MKLNKPLTSVYFRLLGSHLVWFEEDADYLGDRFFSYCYQQSLDRSLFHHTTDNIDEDVPSNIVEATYEKVWVDSFFVCVFLIIESKKDNNIVVRVVKLYFGALICVEINYEFTPIYTVFSLSCFRFKCIYYTLLNGDTIKIF